MPLSIDQIPIPVPSSTDPVNFSARGDAVFGAFPNFITQTNAVASEAAVNRDLTEASKTAAAISETNAATYAANATTSANNASSSSTAPLWVSGTSYSENDKRVSPVTGQVYRRKVSGAGTTDPSQDGVNWYAVLLDADTQYPSIRPTLNLDFVNSGKLDPRITFTRASTATYFDKLGVLRTALNNEPRFDYDPVTLEAKGLLIEESRQNLLKYSSEFDNAAWTKVNATITNNASLAPDGTFTADLLTETNAAGVHAIDNRLQGVAAITAGNYYTVSCYAKLASGTRNLIFSSGNAGVINFTSIFNLSDGVVVGAASGVTATITNCGNGFYRCTASALAASSATGSLTSIGLASGTTPLYTGDGFSGIYIWGAQLEAGAFATSYIPTTSTAVTRQADNAIMTGTNFSSWYNQSQGSFYYEAETSRVDGENTCVFSASDATANYRIESYSGETGHFVVNDATNQASLDMGSFTKNVYSKLAAFYSVNNFAASLNSSAVVTDTLGTVPSVNQLQIGARYNGSFKLNGHIKKLSYFPKIVQQYQLQILTK